MEKLKKILVPLDGSSNSFRALSDAIFLAKLTDSSITGIYVVHSESETDTFFEYLEPLSGLDEKGFVGKQLSEANVMMAEAIEECQKNNVVFNGIVAQGNPGTKIVNFSEKKDFDIIVIGMTGKGHANEILLGSVSYHVTHKAKLPVMLVK
ncbi:MAG: universal stress protein [Nitrosopumilaceae archaeon]